MQQPKTLGDLPQDIWIKIADFGVDRTGKTEAEIFKNIDSLRLTNKKIKAAIDQLISTVAIEKSKNPKTYTYSDFKADIIDEIIKQRLNITQEDINNLIALKQIDRNDKIIKLVFSLEAINWLKIKLKEKKLKLTDDENFEIAEKISNMNPKQLEIWLLLGFDPNSVWQSHGGPTRNPLFFMLEELSKELNLKYSGKPDQSKSLKYIEKWITNLKLLLKYNANPKIKVSSSSIDSKLFSAIRYVLIKRRLVGNDLWYDPLQDPFSILGPFSITECAKFILENYWRYKVIQEDPGPSITGHFTNKAIYSLGKTYNDPIIPKLQEIVKILEEAEKKPYYGTL